MESPSAPENALFWEVALATGATGQQRYADALIMGLWPSRGLELHGVEIKVSRADWQKEAKSPEKAEAIAAYCDRWWVHVAPGVIHDMAEVPPTWGVRQYDGTRWKTLREASKTDAKPMDRKFLASVLRRASESVDRLATERMADQIEVQRKELDRRVAEGIQRATGNKDRAQKTIENLEAALGLTINDGYSYGGIDPTELGALIKALTTSNLTSAYGSLSSVQHSMSMVVNSAAKIVQSIDEAALAIAPFAEAVKLAKDNEVERLEQRLGKKRR